jgi:hypothetical protein
MLKFLIIMALVIYLIYRVMQFFFKIFILGATGQETFKKQYQRKQPTHQHKPKDGNVSIDYVPQSQNKKGSPSNYGGGDYVDYEEVK